MSVLIRTADRTLRTDLIDAALASKGAGIPAFDPALAYVAPSMGYMLKASKWSAMWFPAVRAAVEAGTDVTAAVSAVYALALANGRRSVFFPAHANAYRFAGGVASLDGYKNGLLLPFTTVNADPAQTFVLEGEGGTVFRAITDNQALVRVSRNNVHLRGLTLDAGGRTNVMLCAIVPENMGQTTVQVSQSDSMLEHVNTIGGPGVEGIVYQPGPTVGGADSGCFYHRVVGGHSDFVGGGRHLWAKKGVDWATSFNRITRTVWRDRVLTRGNTGLQIDAGTEIDIHSVSEEMINSDGQMNALATARYIGESDAVAAVRFFGGHAENCTVGVRVKQRGIVRSDGYIPTGSDLDWIAYVDSDGAGVTDRTLTPEVQSSGGGSVLGSSVGWSDRSGSRAYVELNIDIPTAALGAGSLTIAGLAYIANPAWGTQTLNVNSWDGVTLGANYVGLVANIAGTTISLRRQHGQGAGQTDLLKADVGATLRLNISGVYRV